MSNGTIQRVQASCGVQLDQQGDTLVVSVHPFAQLSVLLMLAIVFAFGHWTGKPSETEDDEGEDEQ